MMRPPFRALPPLLLVAASLTQPAAGFAREILGVFQRWGAFRDVDRGRCFAIAQPLPGGWEGSPWRPFVAVGYWPRQAVRGQVTFRLSHQLSGSTAVLAIGDQRFLLRGGGADIWSVDRKMDATIIAAMRSGRLMQVAGHARSGGAFSDRYDLRGAATAIDAAALGCSRVR